MKKSLKFVPALAALFFLGPSFAFSGEMAVSMRIEVAAINDGNAGLTLQNCYELALKRSETIAIKEEIIEETKGQMMQALSNALPKVSFAYSEKWEDEAKRGTLGRSEEEGKFTFTQPLFTGFKELAAVRASKHVGKQREAELKRARQLLLIDVADAFFLYMSYQEDEKALLDTAKALTDRITELNRRQKIGKSRPSEIANAEAKLSRTEATRESVRGQKEVAGQLLAFLIGSTFNNLRDVDDPSKVRTLQEALAWTEARPDVVAAAAAKEALRQNLFSTRSALWPSVSLTGNAYTKRPDANEHNDWDATLTFTVPIFDGLSDRGKLRQARSQLIQADLALEKARREAGLEIRNAYTKWQAYGRRVAALEKAVEAAEKNFFLQIEDFQKNLVNNLDVLQALEDLQSVRRELVAAHADARRSYWAFRVATGDLE